MSNIVTLPIGENEDYVPSYRTAFLLSNPVMPHVVMLGMAKDAADAALQIAQINALETTPLPYECEAAWTMDDALAVHAEMWDIHADVKLPHDFYLLDPDIASTTMIELALKNGGVQETARVRNEAAILTPIEEQKIKAARAEAYEADEEVNAVTVMGRVLGMEASS